MEIVLFSGPEQSFAVVRRILGDCFDVIRTEADPVLLLPFFAKATVYLDASMKVPISAETIHSAANLKLIVTATTGANHIDADALRTRNIPLLTLKGQTEVLRNLTPAAEHSWLLILACARKLKPALQHVNDAGWDRSLFPGTMLRGKTYGVIGCGRIGGWISRYAQAFGMRVIAYDPMQSILPEGVSQVSLDTLLATSDFISLHVNLTAETENLLSAERIKQMKPGCVFVNTSRGELVDESALVRALESGQVAAVGADVVRGEPDIRTNPLWQYSQKHDNVLITPHIGGFCPEAVDQVVEFSCQRILEFFKQ